MSGDSTFGNSNIAAASTSSDTDEMDDNETLEEQPPSKNCSQAADSESDSESADDWRKRNAAMVAKVMEKFGNSMNESLPELPENWEPKVSRWRQKLSQKRDEAQRAREAEQHFSNVTDDSIEEQIRSRRLSRNVTSQSQDPCADIVYKTPLSFSQRHSRANKNAKKQMTQNVDRFEVTDSSIDEEQLRVTCGFMKKHSTKAKAKVVVNHFDSTDESLVVDRPPLSFSQRHSRANKNAKNQMAQNVDAFEVTDSSIDEEQLRVTCGFMKKHSTKAKAKVDVNHFDSTDESLVVDRPPKKSRFFSKATWGRKLTEADINEFDVSDEDEEGDNQGVENEEDKNQGINSSLRSGTRGESNKSIIDDGDSKNNGKSGDEVALDEGGVVEKDDENLEEEGASNSMDKSEESGDEVDGDKNRSLAIPSPMEDAEGEDSLDEEVGEKGIERRKCDENVSNKEERGGRDEQINIVVEEASCNNQSSLDLEYHFSADNHSESRAVGESHNKSALFVSNTRMTVDITMASRRSSLNNSVNKSLVAHGKTSSASKELFSDSRTSSSGKNTSGNKSKQNVNDSIGVLDGSMQPLDVEEMNRSLRGGTDLANRSITKEKNKSRNASKQMNKSREDLMNGSVASNRSLRSRTRGESNKSIIDDGDSKKNGKSGDELFLFMDDIDESQQEVDEVEGTNRILRNRTENGNCSKRMSEKEGSKENSNSVNDSINDSQREERGNSRSLRNKRGRGDTNKSITDKENSKENEKSSNVSTDVVDELHQDVDESENSNRSLRNKRRGRRDMDKSITEEGSSKENCDDVINDAQEEAGEERGDRSLRNRSAAKVKSNKSVTDNQNSKRNFDDSMNSVHDSVGFVSNARTTRRASLAASKEGSGESSPDENAETMNDSLRSSVGTNNRSLRSRSKNNSRVTDRVSPGFGSAEVGEDSPDTGSGEIEARSINGVTYSSEEIVGQKRGQSSEESSLLYNSLDSFNEENRRSVSMLQIPKNVNKRAVNNSNNSLNSTVNETRPDPTFSNQSSDEIMPAPRSVPARKRRLANVDTPSFSSLAQKKKTNNVGETDSISALVKKQNDQVAINNNREVVVTKVDYKCPKLKKPEPWVTKMLYDWIIKRLEPRYKLRSRLRAEEFVVLLCSTVKTVIEKEANYEKDIEDLKYEMARLNLIQNLFQFFMFIYDFLPWQFHDRSLPLPQACIGNLKVVTYDKGTLYDPIL